HRLSVFGIQYGRAVFLIKNFLRKPTASFLEFMQLLIRLGRKIGVKAHNPDNRSADGWPARCSRLAFSTCAKCPEAFPPLRAGEFQAPQIRACWTMQHCRPASVPLGSE